MIQVDIDGFENYQITDDGRVWSKKSQRYLTPTFSQDGYLRVKLCYGGQMKKDKWVSSLQYKGYIWKYANN